MPAHPVTFAIIVAAGQGLRARGGSQVPKQFRPLGGKPLLAWSLEAFAEHPQVDGVLMALAADALASARPGPESPKILPPVAGGATRQASVLNGLLALADRAPARVLIHDAARPLVSQALISRVIDALDEAPGALPVLPVSDTLKRGAAGGVVEATVAREGLWRAQTPQGFDFRAILAAHQAAAGKTYTDDAAVAEAAGLAVKLVEGDPRNLKITQGEDFALAEALIGAGTLHGPIPPSSWEGAKGSDSNERGGGRPIPLPNPPRQGEGNVMGLLGATATGQGFDVHRLIPGDGVWLCGIRIPCEYKLLGHSDADAGLHALTDAILGAVAADDIGVHFPPTDERWRNAPSDQFLLHALELMHAAGGRLRHIDVTLICEKPRISPHRAAMRARLAELTGLPLARVSVKATTTEGLGFTGRGEGITAQAIATVVLSAK